MKKNQNIVVEKRVAKESLDLFDFDEAAAAVDVTELDVAAMLESHQKLGNQVTSKEHIRPADLPDIQRENVAERLP